jgi:hypothetical protein
MKRLEKMSYLVYWYGEANQKAMYSLIGQSTFIPYYQAIAKNPIVPKSLQNKVDAKEPLSKQETLRNRARQEVEQDLAKEPSERRRGVVNFLEGYHRCKEDGDERHIVDGEPNVAIGTMDNGGSVDHVGCRPTKKKRRIQIPDSEMSTATDGRDVMNDVHIGNAEEQDTKPAARVADVSSGVQPGAAEGDKICSAKIQNLVDMARVKVETDDETELNQEAVPIINTTMVKVESDDESEWNQHAV